jgi:hypothetical protein
MAVCDCCGRDKPDVKIRVGLRGLDHRGHITAKPFHGPLCDDCLARASRFGSAEQRWLFNRILQGTLPVQERGLKPKRGEVIPLRPVRPKPSGPRGH